MSLNGKQTVTAKVFASQDFVGTNKNKVLLVGITVVCIIADHGDSSSEGHKALWVQNKKLLAKEYYV